MEGEAITSKENARLLDEAVGGAAVENGRAFRPRHPAPAPY
jgi:hypothetical protein